jgi:hypothetical protein
MESVVVPARLTEMKVKAAGFPLVTWSIGTIVTSVPTGVFAGWKATKEGTDPAAKGGGMGVSAPVVGLIV